MNQTRTWRTLLAMLLIAGFSCSLPAYAQDGGAAGAEAEETEEERKAREEAERKKKEEEEKKRKEEEERKKKEEEERKRKEEERKKKEEEERKKKEEEEKKRKEEEEKERKAAAKDLREEDENAWMVGQAVGINYAWLFSDLTELNDITADGNGIEAFDATGLARLELTGDLYLNRNFLLRGAAGATSTIGSDTSYTYAYGAIEPALVVPEGKLQLLLGLRVSVGSYKFEGERTELTTGTVTGDAGYEGVGATFEPGLTLRYIPNEDLAVDFRVSFRQFIELSNSPEGGAVELGSLPGDQAGEELLSFAAPALSIGVSYGSFPQPLPPIEDYIKKLEEEDAK